MKNMTMPHLDPKIVWTPLEHCKVATIGDFAGGDGVRFSLSHRPNCYRRGPYWMLIEIASGHGHVKWGCFDGQDQPTRYYHLEQSAHNEAQALAKVLVKDRARAE